MKIKVKSSGNLQKELKMYNNFSTGPHKFVMEKWISCAPFEKLLNMEIVEAKNGRAILKMPFYIQYAQGAGLMHGGALTALADTAVVMAIKSILDKGTHFATIEMHGKFLKPVIKGIITAKAEIYKKDGRILKGKADVLNDEGIKVFEFNSIFKIAKDAKIKNITFKE